MTLRLLAVDDDDDLRAVFLDELPRRGFAVTCAANVVDARAALDAASFDVVVTDLRMPRGSGLLLVDDLVRDFPDVAVVVLTGFGSVDVGVEAMRRGAVDFLEKPVDLERLAASLKRAHELVSLRGEVKRLRPAPTVDDEVLTGRSPAIERVRTLVRDVGPLRSTVLITGESGTGKELVARALHRLSPRARGPFVAVNVAALPDTLVEATLFGHRKGAFTDAREDRDGVFAQARGGTLFLDEIGEMPLALQTRLLRVLQERKVRRLGDDAEIDVDFRLVCATHRNLDEQVDRGAFRDDLRWRIDVVGVELPPLRARGQDILLLAQAFIDQHAARLKRDVRSLAPAAAEVLLRWRWPGNVRELENAIERAVGLARFDQVLVSDLPPRLLARADEAGAEAAAFDADESLASVEMRHILAVLARANGNKQLAAQRLGIGRKTLYRRLRDAGAAIDDED